MKDGLQASFIGCRPQTGLQLITLRCLFQMFKDEKLYADMLNTFDLVYNEEKSNRILTDFCNGVPLPLLRASVPGSSFDADRPFSVSLTLHDGIYAVHEILAFLRCKRALTIDDVPYLFNPLTLPIEQNEKRMILDSALEQCECMMMLPADRCETILNYSLVLNITPLLDDRYCKLVTSMQDKVKLHGAIMECHEMQSQLAYKIAKELRGLPSTCIPFQSVSEYFVYDKELSDTVKSGKLADSIFWCRFGIMSFNDLQQMKDASVIKRLLHPLAGFHACEMGVSEEELYNRFIATIDTILAIFGDEPISFFPYDGRLKSTDVWSMWHGFQPLFRMIYENQEKQLSDYDKAREIITKWTEFNSTTYLRDLSMLFV